MKESDYDAALNYKNHTAGKLLLAIVFSLLSVAVWQSVAAGDLLNAPIRGAGGTADALSGARLNRHLSQLEEYGSAGFKELQNGRCRYFGDLKPPRTPGTMAGTRRVREWDPASGSTRTWFETLDHSGRVRIVRPETGGPKIHYMFDEFGNFTGTF